MYYVVLDGECGWREVRKEHCDHFAILIECNVLGQLLVSAVDWWNCFHEQRNTVILRKSKVVVDGLTNITTINNEGWRSHVCETPINHILHRHRYRIFLLFLVKNCVEEWHCICYWTSTYKEANNCTDAAGLFWRNQKKQSQMMCLSSSLNRPTHFLCINIYYLMSDTSSIYKNGEDGINGIPVRFFLTAMILKISYHRSPSLFLDRVCHFHRLLWQ